MDSNLTFLLKILALSIALSVAIKYFAPELEIPPTSTAALIGVLAPAGLMAAALLWRLWQKPQSDRDQIDLK
jgi:hypothetical protein